MKNLKVLIILASILSGYGLAYGQKSIEKPVVKKCHVPADSTLSNKLTLAEIQAWADKLPLEVICEDSSSFRLSQFNFTIINMNPMQTKEYGTGNDGIPIMARKAIDKLSTGDTILMREVKGKDDAGNIIPLPNIVLSVKE